MGGEFVEAGGGLVWVVCWVEKRKGELRGEREGKGGEDVPVECPVSVEELKEEGRCCLAVDFGCERLRGHYLGYGEQ